MFYFQYGFRKIVGIGLMALCIMGLSRISEAKVRVVATTEHEALLARQVGGDLIEVKWIVNADEDPHFVEPNKRFIPMLNRADLLLVNGQDIEIGWITFLLTDGRNEKILRDHEDYINLSEGVSLIPYAAPELRQTKFYTVILGMGLGKTIGNHHYWLDPANEIPMIDNIKDALSKVDPEHAKTYESNANQLNRRLEEKIKEWDAKMEPFKGKKIISFHRDWTYIAKRHGLDIVAYIEPREMVRPTSADISHLASVAQNKGVSSIFLSASQRPPYIDTDAINGLATQIHSKVGVLPDSMSEGEKLADVVAYFDKVYEELEKTLK